MGVTVAVKHNSFKLWTLAELLYGVANFKLPILNLTQANKFNMYTECNNLCAYDLPVEPLVKWFTRVYAIWQEIWRALYQFWSMKKFIFGKFLISAIINLPAVWPRG